MTQATKGDETADEFCEDCGYETELKRSLNGFQMFAVSFASVSVVIGIFSTYDDVLQGSGPVGIWLFPIVAVGQILVALVYAQFAARIPLSGSSYAWASRLANPKIGWAFGWLAVISAIRPSLWRSSEPLWSAWSRQRATSSRCRATGAFPGTRCGVGSIRVLRHRSRRRCWCSPSGSS